MSAIVELGLPVDYDVPEADLRPHWSVTDDRYADLPARFRDDVDEIATVEAGRRSQAVA